MDPIRSLADAGGITIAAAVEVAAAAIATFDLVEPLGIECARCTGNPRETVGMVCQSCGADYGEVRGG